MINDPDMEKEANLFARCLLMPESLMRKEVKRALDKGRRVDLLDERDFDHFIGELARKFQVPRVAMTMRLHELGILDF